MGPAAAGCMGPVGFLRSGHACRPPHAWPAFPPLLPCSAPSTLQFPAALAHGLAISLGSLKLNGRPLLRAPLHVSQATAAADGCLAQLYRLPSRATKSGFVLSGWLQLGEGGGGGAAGDGGAVGGSGSVAASQAQHAGSGGGSNSDQFGVGEMSSLELTLGEYSALDAAAARLLGGIGGGAQVAAGVAQP